MVARTRTAPNNNNRGVLTSTAATGNKPERTTAANNKSSSSKNPATTGKGLQTKNSNDRKLQTRNSNDRKTNNNNNKHDDNGSSQIQKHFSEYPKIDQAIINMKASLGRFTRANDRRMVLRTLKEVKYLKAMPIVSRPPPMLDLEELEMEVAKENLVLNGQAFHRKTKFGRTSTDFLHVLHELCYMLCENSSGSNNNFNCNSTASVGVASSVLGGAGGGPTGGGGGGAQSVLSTTVSPDTLYYDILCRLARTITSADCFAKLNDILGSNDLILMNSSAERKPKAKKAITKTGTSIVLPGELSAIPPIEVNIFEEGGNIHAQIVTTLGYGLYRKLDITTGRPWIKLQAELMERTNFSCGASVRHVTVHWYGYNTNIAVS